MGSNPSLRVLWQKALNKERENEMVKYEIIIKKLRGRLVYDSIKNELSDMSVSCGFSEIRERLS